MSQVRYILHIFELNCKRYFFDRDGLNTLFELKNPQKEYSSNNRIISCQDLKCEDTASSCSCSLCRCCTVCAQDCCCARAISDPDQKLADILGLSDEKYIYLDLDITY